MFELPQFTLSLNKLKLASPTKICVSYPLRETRAFLKKNKVKFTDIINKLVKITKRLNKRSELELSKLFLRGNNPKK